MNKKMQIKKQTAVEWLVKYLSERGYIQAPSFGHSIIDKAIEQAKEMEKEQIMDDLNICLNPECKNCREWEDNIKKKIEIK